LAVEFFYLTTYRSVLNLFASDGQTHLEVNMKKHEHLDLYLMTLKTKNRKVGNIPVSMSSPSTCPPSCGMRGVCYAVTGKLGLVWWKLGQGGLTNGTFFSDFCRQVRQLPESVTVWRHNQSGDLPGHHNRLSRNKCFQLAESNRSDGRNRGGYTYTHYPVFAKKGVSERVAHHNREVIAEMNARGFTVNLSADNTTEADKLSKLDIGPVVTVLPSTAKGRQYTPEGRRIRVCPAVLSKKVSCATCGVCNVQDRPIIGFPAHGNSRKKVDAMLKGVK
jgi:hypothetical protein